MDAEDPALIVFTSGTTGNPRGVVHAYRYLFGQEIQATHWFGSRPGELAWCTTATGWSKSARNVFLAPWLTGAAAVIHDGRFDPPSGSTWSRRSASTCSARRRPSTGCWPGGRPAAAAALRRMVSAGEPLDPETIAAFREATGLEPADGYGQTETGQVTGNLAGEPVRAGLDGQGPARAGGPDRATASCSCAPPPPPPSSPATSTASASRASGGRPATWSQADEDGYLFFDGRNDDIIASSGYRIGPTEVEAALMSHPAVVEAAAVAAPDPERGAVVRAIVVVRDREPGEGLVARAEGALQTRDRPLQGTAHRRVRRRAAEDQQRQGQAGRAARRLTHPR